MKKKILIAAGILAAIILIAVGILSTMSNEYLVSRSVTINAPMDRVHKHVGNLDNWEAWTPWSKQDPTLKVTYGEPREGVGANQSWVGKDGDGRLVFTKCDPASGVEFDLWFQEDSMKCLSGYDYSPGETPGTTVVTWRMAGDVPVPVFGGLIASKMDGMVGPMFDQGLADLKTVVEADTGAAAAMPDGVTDRPARAAVPAAADDEVIIDDTVTAPAEEDLAPTDGMPDDGM